MIGKAPVRATLEQVRLLEPKAARADRAEADRQSPSYTALHRSRTLTERALGQSASFARRSVSLASPCSAMSRSTL